MDEGERPRRGTSLRVPGQEEAAQGNPGVFERKEGTHWFYRMAERSLWASSGASAWTLGRKSGQMAKFKPL